MRTHFRAVTVGTTLLSGLLLAAGLTLHRNGSAALVGHSPEEAGNASLASAHWKDLEGHAYTAAEWGRHKATVFFFVSMQCPIANLYSPRLREIAQKYTTSGVQFFLVDSNREETPEALRRYAHERGLAFPAIKDQGTALADLLAADRTPEAVIVDASGTVRYRGRIDDNTDRERIIRQDVRDALEALLAGKAPPRARTQAFGCAIFRDRSRPAVEKTSAVTYTRDVAPILVRNCVSCHRPGEAGPFALETYQEAKTWAVPIKEYTTRRQMPPWKAAPGYGDFHDARVMTPREIAVLARWADAGAPQGNPADLPPAAKRRPSPEWRLGQPDLVLQAARPYHLEAEGRDVYREFVLPADFKEDRFLKAIEFRPDNRAVVHHMIVFFDPTGVSGQLEGKETEPGYSVPGVGIGTPQSTWVAGWAAGATPYQLPEGTAYRLPAGQKIVLQVHYHKDGKIETDQSRIGLHFVDRARVEKEIHVHALVNAGFHLLPGKARQEVRASMTLPAPVHVWAVFPHMHLLGREMKLTATLPDGTGKPLIWINDWDFNWQETYRYKEPLALPAGTKIDLVAVFDNSERNPHQPAHPPKDVYWGEQTTDEMCIGFFQYTQDRQHLANR